MSEPSARQELTAVNVLAEMRFHVGAPYFHGGANSFVSVKNGKILPESETVVSLRWRFLICSLPWLELCGWRLLGGLRFPLKAPHFHSGSGPSGCPSASSSGPGSQSLCGAALYCCGTPTRSPWAKNLQTK